MRILVLCGKLRSYSYLVSSENLRGPLRQILSQGEVKVDTRAFVDWRRASSFIDWNIANSGTYDVIIVCTSTFFSSQNITPLDVYIWYELLIKNGKLMLVNKLPLCDITGDFQTKMDNYKVLTQLQGLFLPDKTYLVKVSRPTKDPWEGILHWACRRQGSSQNHWKIVLELAPEYIVGMFNEVAKFAVKSSLVNREAKSCSRKLLEIISGLGTVTVPTLSPDLCSSIRGLDWHANSCYMDSSLHSMLAVPCILSQFLLNVELTERDQRLLICGRTPALDLLNRKRLQEELRRIVSTIRGNSSASNKVTTANRFRNLLRTCNLKESQQWWSAREQDAGEFISWLLSLFPISRGIVIQRNYVTNDVDANDFTEMRLTSVLNDTTASPVWDLNNLYELKEETPLTYFLATVEDSGELDDENLARVDVPNEIKFFKRRVGTRTLTQAPGAIIFNANRGGGGGLIADAERWNKVPLTPVQHIELSSRQVFEFSSVVIYNGAHYTCYYKCGDTWFFYNDMHNLRELTTPIRIGDYDTLMLRYGAAIKTRGTLYFYNQIRGPKGLPVPLDHV